MNLSLSPQLQHALGIPTAEISNTVEVDDRNPDDALGAIEDRGVYLDNPIEDLVDIMDPADSSRRYEVDAKLFTTPMMPDAARASFKGYDGILMPFLAILPDLPPCLRYACIIPPGKSHMGVDYGTQVVLYDATEEPVLTTQPADQELDADTIVLAFKR